MAPNQMLLYFFSVLFKWCSLALLMVKWISKQELDETTLYQTEKMEFFLWALSIFNTKLIRYIINIFARFFSLTYPLRALCCFQHTEGHYKINSKSYQDPEYIQNEILNEYFDMLVTIWANKYIPHIFLTGHRKQKSETLHVVN